jgi:hypothetical protein
MQREFWYSQFSLWQQGETPDLSTFLIFHVNSPTWLNLAKPYDRVVICCQADATSAGFIEISALSEALGTRMQSLASGLNVMPRILPSIARRAFRC